MTMPTTIDPVAIQQNAERLVHSFLEPLNAHSWEGVREITSSDMRHQLLPRSLGRPSRTRDEWLSALDRYSGLMPNLKITLEGDVLGGADFACFHVRNCYPCRDVGAHVSIQATGQGSTANGIRYQNEYFFVLRTRSNDDGESHIITVDEMCDSSAINAFTEKMATASKSG
jgi:hypothetical protein